MPQALGAIDFESEFETAVVAEYDGHVYLGDSANFTTIRRGYPPDGDKYCPFTQAELNAIEVRVEFIAHEIAGAGSHWMKYRAIIDIYTQHGSRTTAETTNGRARQEAIACLVHRAVNNTTDFISSAEHVLTAGVDPGPVEFEKTNSTLARSKSSVELWVLWIET